MLMVFLIPLQVDSSLNKFKLLFGKELVEVSFLWTTWLL